MRRGHAETLMPMIERVMTKGELGFADLDRLVVAHGPGTFSGTRIAIAAARGFSLAQRLPVVTRSSLLPVGLAVIDELGEHAEAYDAVLVTRDAKRERMYAQLVARTGRELCDPVLVDAAEAAAMCGDHRVIVVGSGARMLAELETVPAPNISLSWPVNLSGGITEPDAKYLLPGAERLAPASPPRPLYLRPPDAAPSNMAVPRASGHA